MNSRVENFSRVFTRVKVSYLAEQSILYMQDAVYIILFVFPGVLHMSN